MEALATGRSWLMDKPKLRDLAGMNRVRTILTKLDEYQKRWKSLPLNIYVSVSAGLSGSLAQYSFDSIDALEEKLAQFPSDTEFVLNTPEDSEGGAQCHARLLAFLASHGMTIRKDERTHSSFY